MTSRLVDIHKGVQRSVVVEVIFFRIFEISFLCFVVALFDIVRDV